MTTVLRLSISGNSRQSLPEARDQSLFNSEHQINSWPGNGVDGEVFVVVERKVDLEKHQPRLARIIQTQLDVSLKSPIIFEERG